jgi:CCR4-NOT transcriptional regulation complex NOT5 subunit
MSFKITYYQSEDETVPGVTHTVVGEWIKFFDYNGTPVASRRADQIDRIDEV